MPRETERERQRRMTTIESPFWEQGIALAGMDEAGRGPLAGPVVAACVILPRHPLIEGVNDSKKVAPAKREKLFEQIAAQAVSFGVGFADEKEIDEVNILVATKRAMCRAVTAMERQPSDILIDAVTGLELAARQHASIAADANSYLVAAASILAKVTRDRMMTELDALYPHYGFARHKGYGTAEHIEAIRRYGPCPIHRLSFIGKFIGETEGAAHGAQSAARLQGRSVGGVLLAEQGL